MSLDRKALLLFGSSHESVPGIKVWYNAAAYFSAAAVSFELMTTRLCSSTILAPWAHSAQWVQALASPTALPSANPQGVPFFFSAWHNLRNPCVSFGTLSKPAALIMLSRYTRQPPRNPDPMAIHFPSWMQKRRTTSYQPPYLPSR